MRVYLLFLCLVLFGFPCCSSAPAGPKIHTKDVIIEKTLQVKGLGSNNDVDVLEVDANSNLKGDVRVGKELHVVQNVTVDQGVTIAQGLTVGGNVEVGANLDIDGALNTEDLRTRNLEVDDSALHHGDITFDGLGKAMPFVNNLRVRLESAFAERFGEAIRGTLVDYVLYNADTGSWSFNGAKVLYNPTDGWNMNNGAMRINTTNDDKEMTVSNKGEFTLQRGENNESCALILKENPNITEGIELLQVQGKSRFTQEMKIDGDLIVEGDFVSSGGLRSYATDTDVKDFMLNTVVGELFSATANCIGTKVVIGGGCAISGLTTGLALKQNAPIGKNYLCQYVQTLTGDNEFHNDTTTTAIDVEITATVFCATSVA